MLRGAVFGAGRMGTHHLRKLQARSGVHVQAVDPQQGLTEVPDQMDFAIIATPSTTHMTVALPLLERGIPCLIEKPLAASIEEAQGLAQYPHLMVGHIERFNPALDPVKDLRPRFIQSERLAPFSGRSTDISVVDDLMIHDLDLALMWLGPNVNDVRGVGVGVLTGQPDITNVRLEIGAGVASLTASRVSQKPVRQLRLVEDDLYWSIDLVNHTVHQIAWGAGELEAKPVPVPVGDALTREHHAFLAAVRGEATMAITGEDGLAAMRLAQQVSESLGRTP